MKFCKSLSRQIIRIQEHNGKNRKNKIQRIKYKEQNTKNKIQYKEYSNHY